MRASAASRHWLVAALAGAAVLLRLPYLLAPEGSDEGGYLAVARQWHRAGPSLYGHYWVDRPPLLITLFQLSSSLGGLPALRVLGALCAGAAVLGVGDACRRSGGQRGAVAGAAVAAALFVSPQLGTVQVNGELLAAPFVAWSIALTLRAVGPSKRTDSVPASGTHVLGAGFGAAFGAAFGAGAFAVAALLVKQNLAEPLVFAAVLLPVALWTGGSSRSRLRRVVVAAAAGAATVLGLAGAWTLLHGTSVAGVFDAVYPFRVRAAEVLATLPDRGQAHRAGLLMRAFLGSGVLLVVVAFARAALGRRDAPMVWGLSATLLWASSSVVLGGGFWDHYLVELVIPVSMAAGLAWAGRGDRASWRDGVLLPAVAAGLVVAVSLSHWAGGLATRMPRRGVAVGTAIAAVADRRDTVVSVVGDAETVQTSGLWSPYPYLWTLPAQVDDPRLSRLTALLQGAHAPTWLVPWDRPSFPASTRSRLEAVVASRYRPVGVVCGRPVLLRDGVVRRSPPSEACSGPAARW